MEFDHLKLPLSIFSCIEIEKCPFLFLVVRTKSYYLTRILLIHGTNNQPANKNLVAVSWAFFIQKQLASYQKIESEALEARKRRNLTIQFRNLFKVIKKDVKSSNRMKLSCLEKGETGTFFNRILIFLMHIWLWKESCIVYIEDSLVYSK